MARFVVISLFIALLFVFVPNPCHCGRGTRAAGRRSRESSYAAPKPAVEHPNPDSISRFRSRMAVSGWCLLHLVGTEYQQERMVVVLLRRFLSCDRRPRAPLGELGRSQAAPAECREKLSRRVSRPASTSEVKRPAPGEEDFGICPSCNLAPADLKKDPNSFNADRTRAASGQRPVRLRRPRPAGSPLVAGMITQGIEDLSRRILTLTVFLSVSVRKGTTFSGQWGPPERLRRDPFDHAQGSNQLAGLARDRSVAAGRSDRSTEAQAVSR